LGFRLDVVPGALDHLIATLDETRLAAHVYDAGWRLVHVTGAQRANTGAEPAIGAPMLSPQFTDAVAAGGAVSREDIADYGRGLVPFVVHDEPAGRDAVRQIADPLYHATIDAAEPQPLPSFWTGIMQVRTRAGQRVPLRSVVFRAGEGVLELWLPNLSGDLLAALTLADTGHLERLGHVIRSERRPAAILFADLQASTPLARRLSTESYFRLVRRIMRAVDQLVVNNGGLVGRHVGDGLTAFYPAELCGGEEQAAVAALRTATNLAPAVLAAAATVPNAGDVRVNAGVHWGATVRLGAIMTAARFEVTALGEEVNEAARIEACATGGRVLASKQLLERIGDAAIAQLGIDPDGSYEPLGDVAGAPDKARRDAATLAVRAV
jgi:class 3 adenylate cyclase